MHTNMVSYNSGMVASKKLRAKDVMTEIRKFASPKRAKDLAWFFKTGKGQYGEDDKFLGLFVPQGRQVAVLFKDLPLVEISKLLKSKYHEDRFVALEILVIQFEKASLFEQKKIVDFYLKNKNGVNNWDLVDTSAPYILGKYLFENPKERKILKTLALSKSLWDRRIAIVSTLYFVSKKRFTETLFLTKLLINDKHDLIHKACGWALREIYKKEAKVIEDFLKTNAKKLPRTTLRYSIERMPQNKRLKFLKM